MEREDQPATDVVIERAADGPWRLQRRVRLGATVRLHAATSPGFRFADAVSSDPGVAGVTTERDADGSVHVAIATRAPGEAVVRLTDAHAGDPRGPAGKTLTLTIAVS